LPLPLKTDSLSEITRKKEGFQGQKAVIIPRKILSVRCAHNDIISNLYITDIGYYPKAEFHYRQRQHGADQHILIYCHEGTGSVQIGNKEYTVQPNEFFFIPAKTPHVYEADKKKPWTIYWVHFKGHIANSVMLLMEKQFAGYKGVLHYNTSIVNLFNEMYSQLERGYSLDNLLYANMCLWHFLTTFIFNTKSNPVGGSRYKDPADKAIDFLSNRINRVLTLEEISNHVNLSPSHFAFLFKKKTGFAPIEYFNHLKVQKACQYLLFTNLRIKEIALELGIDDQYYFSRLFKKVMGMPPEEYREKRIH
jgi:AraC-like DNA-binding protein/mannose-6-phosphate isomerase-like protein (cupin superfamily)